MKGAVSPLTLSRPRTIHDALNMLRDDPVLVPIARCTDIDMSLEVCRLAASEFLGHYPGYRKSGRRPDELILAIEIPKQNGAQWFRKVGTRAAQAISKIVMAAVQDPAGPRIALGSVAATTIRLPKTEAALAKGLSIE